MKSSMPKISDEHLKDYQERKNLQDFIYDTNQSLQRLNTAIISLSIQNERVIAKSESDKKALLIEFEKMVEKVNSSLDDIKQRMGNLETDLLSENMNIKFNIQSIVKSYAPKADVNMIQSVLDAKIKEVSDFIRSHIESTISSNRLIYGTVQSEIAKVREDLAPKDDKLDHYLHEIDNRFCINDVNIIGISQELNILKSNQKYNEKKFEDIYTLIERLQEGNA